MTKLNYDFNRKRYLCDVTILLSYTFHLIVINTFRRYLVPGTNLCIIPKI